jgi:hypothetical protein
MLVLNASDDLAAQGFYYHFSGRVSQIEFDDAGLIAASGLTIGSPVEYTFFVDFQRPGTVTHYDGNVEVLEDIPRPGEMGNVTAHFFYADFLGGSFLRDDAAEQLRPNNGWLDRNYGALFGAASSLSGTLVGGGVYHYVGVYQENIDGGVPPLPWGYTFDDPSVQQWQIGEHVLAVSSASNADLAGSLFRAEVTLDQITPVPEPATGLLVATCAVLWVGYRWLRTA